jgi:UDP-MurNAc hydroxylase
MIKFLGHASFYFKYEDVSLVIDPWFSKTGAFLGSWAQFPDNSEIDFSWVNDLTYVCITHEHEDHFDLEWLAKLNKTTKIIIPKYEDRHLATLLKLNISNQIIEVPSKTTYKLNDEFSICPIIQSVPIWDDCSYVLQTPEGTFLDLNDMKPASSDLDWIKDNFNIDYLAIQFSGANWHPMVYDYSDERKCKIAKSKIEVKYKSVLRIFEELNVTYLIPNAGPPCFLSQDQYDLNFAEYSIFPTQEHFYQYAKRQGISDKTIVLLPDDIFDPTQNLQELTNENIENECFVDKRSYLRKYKERRQPIINKYLDAIETPQYKLIDKIKNYFQPFISQNKFYRDQINGVLLLDIRGVYNEKIAIDFSKPFNSIKEYDNESYFCKFEIESKYLNLILDHKTTWEELLLSLRFKALRRPDEYNESLVVCLRFMRQYSGAAITQYEHYETNKMLSETFEYTYENQKYNIQRRCPHALGDLSKGEEVDGHIVCPLHGWKFDIKTGQCQGKKGYSIKQSKVEDQH